MKDNAEVVAEFGELVNMTAQELRDWLESDDSINAGWSGDKTDGESVGHESGRKIIEILEGNPKMEADKYTEEQVQHMRKVVSYCKRHLAQEERSNNEKPVEEVKKTKSYASLKNWGHDCIKAREGGEKKGGKGAGAQEEGKATAKGQKAGDKREAAVVIDDDDDDDEEEEEDSKKGGNKSEKKRKTEDGGKKEEEEVVGEEEIEDDFEEVEEEGDEDFEDIGDEEDEEEEEEDGGGGGGGGKGEEKQEGKGKGKGKGPQKGDTVSWNWAGGQPEGKVLDVKGEETSITTKRGNEVSRKGNPDDPAVVLDTGKSKALKLDHELNE